MVIMMMSAGTSLADDVSPCLLGVDTVPIQILSQSNPGPATTFSEIRIVDNQKIGYPSGFNVFVTTVIKHLTARLAQEKLCLNSAESQEQSLLQFVPRYITVSYRGIQVPPVELRPAGVCRISSPWIDIAIERTPVPWVRGIVRWNTRQILADQAVLAGVRNVPPGAALPLEESDYSQYRKEYQKANAKLIPTPEEKLIQESLPPDILWLFNRAGMSYHFLEGVANTTVEVSEASAEGYTKIVIALIDHCFASGGADLQYNSVLDVADLIPLEQYKIVKPIHGIK